MIDATSSDNSGFHLRPDSETFPRYPGTRSRLWDEDGNMLRDVARNNDVYSTCMARTNLYINNELLDLVIRRYNLRTKTEAVDMALRHLAGKPMTTTEALAMRGAKAIDDAPPDQPPS